jgi:hypothetical protein
MVMILSSPQPSAADLRSRHLHKVPNSPLEAEIERRGGDDGVDLPALEKAFTKHAAAYSASKGI